MEKYSHSTQRRTAILAIVAATALSLVACGSNPGGNVTSDAAGRQSSISELPTKLAEYTRAPLFKDPGPAFDAMSAAKDKSLFLIPASSEVPFVQNIGSGIKALGSQVGLKVTDWKNQGKTAQHTEGMTNAIAQKTSSIDLLAGLDPATVGPQIAQAKAAGIDTIASHLYDPAQAPLPALAATVDAPYQRAGELLADYAINKTQGKLNALVVTINEVNSTKPMVNGIKQEIGKYCADTCKLSYINSSISQLATQVPSDVRGALQRDPKINYIIALYDSAQVPFVISGIESSGSTNPPKIITYNGTPSMLKLVAEGKIEMDIGENLTWISLAVLDQHLRLFAGLPPLRIWDATNIAEAGSPPMDSKGFGDEYLTAYAKLWKLPTDMKLGSAG
jgi:ribose transport system substrate-binding protein